MVRYKNISGGPSIGDESPPRLTEVARGKRKKIAAKKRKRTLTEAEIAQAVADVAELAERGGRSSGIHIGESRFYLEGRQLSTEAIEETEDPPAEQPTEDTEEIEEQTVQTPPGRHSGRMRAQVTPRPEGQRRGGRPPPRARGHPPVKHFDLRGARARQVQALRLVDGSHLRGTPELQRASTHLCTRISIEPMLTVGLHSDLREFVDLRL
jgi:hypothetical protein